MGITREPSVSNSYTNILISRFWSCDRSNARDAFFYSYSVLPQRVRRATKRVTTMRSNGKNMLHSTGPRIFCDLKHVVSSSNKRTQYIRSTNKFTFRNLYNKTSTHSCSTHSDPRPKTNRYSEDSSMSNIQHQEALRS